jgi:hypothetical protein
MLCWPHRGRLKKPDNLAILLIHNRDYKTLVEHSLDYLGIEGYSVVRPKLPGGRWTNSAKIPAALDFVRNCSEDYILYIDSDDAVLVGDPQRAIDLLDETGAEMIISTTEYLAYQLMPALQPWFRELADSQGWPHAKNVHINSGVYVASRSLLETFLEAAAKYVTDSDIPLADYKIKRRLGAMPSFPFGCGEDQAIFRFVFPAFADKARLDYSERLAIR